MRTTTHTVAYLLIFIITSPAPHATASMTDNSSRASGKLDATFLSLESATSRVTYREARTGAVKTLRVSSPAALETLARFKEGQKVVLKYQSADDMSEPVITDVAKKVNWWKRGAIIFGVVVIGLAAWVVTHTE